MGKSKVGGKNGNGIPFGHPNHPCSGKQARALRTDHRSFRVRRREAVDSAVEDIKEAVMDDTINKEELGKRALKALGEILTNTNDERLKGTTAKTLLEFTTSKPTAYSESKVEVKKEPTSAEMLEEFDKTIQGECEDITETLEVNDDDK